MIKSQENSPGMRPLPFLIVLWLSCGTRTKLLWKFEVIIKLKHILIRGGQLSYSMFHWSIGQSVHTRTPPTPGTSDKVSSAASNSPSRVSARSSCGRPSRSSWSRPSIHSAYISTPRSSSNSPPHVCSRSSSNLLPGSKSSPPTPSVSLITQFKEHGGEYHSN